VNSPTPSGSSQADLYRPLRLPIFLVADAKLGGISSTISAFESLYIRGYELDSLLVFQDNKYQNHDYLSQYFLQRGIQTISLPPPPPRRKEVLEDHEEMAAYYEQTSESDAVEELLALSYQRHNARIERLVSMADEAHKNIWYPFTQHKDLNAKKILTIDSAHGDFFQTLTRSPSLAESSDSMVKLEERGLLQSTFDGSASWWTQGLGHGSPILSLAAAHAAGRYGHVMFAGAIHEPALSLAQLLLTHLENPRLKKVFYSDDGSTGMEVAIKMALTASSKRYGWLPPGEVDVLGLKGSYHGDTIGAMDLSEASTYNEKVHWYEGRGYWFDFPQVKMKNSEWIVELPVGMEKAFSRKAVFGSLEEIFSGNRDKSEMAKRYEYHIRETLARLVKDDGRRFGALVLEPVILGAGGMLFWYEPPVFYASKMELTHAVILCFSERSSTLFAQAKISLALRLPPKHHLVAVFHGKVSRWYSMKCLLACIVSVASPHHLS
jgi:bifunctional dethiobiotin synthetase / adenosylmethionine---8-amino-7-oxononanoate aminotransferase